MSNKTKQTEIQSTVKIQPALLALIHVVLAFALAWFLPLPFIVPPILRNAGFLLVVLGFLLGMAALLVFRRSRTRGVVGLVTSGIYGFTRNPIYLGFVLILIGIMLNGGSYWGLLLAPVLVILYNWLVIGPEEAYLAQKYGNIYINYKAKVRRWL